MKQLSPKDPRDNVPVGIGMASRLAAGETILSCVCSVQVQAGMGTDPAPSAMLDGAPILTALPKVYQRIKGGIPGVTYIVSAVCTTDKGTTRVGSVLLPVNNGGA